MRLLTFLLLRTFFLSFSSEGIKPSRSAEKKASRNPQASTEPDVCTGKQQWHGFTAEEQAELQKEWSEYTAEEQAELRLSPFFKGEPEPPGSPAAIFEPEGEQVGYVVTNDVGTSVAGTGFASSPTLGFLTLPPDACRYGSLYDAESAFAVTAGTIDIFVNQVGNPNAPASEGTIQHRDGTPIRTFTLPGSIAINEDEQITLQDRSVVGFWNRTSSNASFHINATHASQPFGVEPLMIAHLELFEGLFGDQIGDHAYMRFGRCGSVCKSKGKSNP